MLAAFLLAALPALPLAAAAQEAAPSAAPQLGPPLRLVPPPAPRPRGSVAAPPDAAASGAGGIAAEPLPPPDPSWAGSLAISEGALPPNLWAGTPRALVAAALPLLVPTTSPALQDLARRLLLSDATPPEGGDPPEGPSLLALRLDRIVALGLVDGAIRLLGKSPSGGGDEAGDRRRLELRLMAGDKDGACRLADAAVAGYQGPWWERALVACQALAGDLAKAALGLGLLREGAAPRDPAFETLVEALTRTSGGSPPRLEHLPEPTPILLALAAEARAPLPADALAAAGPGLLAQWALSRAVPVAQRLPVAERAAALGALPLDRLRELYGKVDFTPEEAAAALSGSSAAEGTRDLGARRRAVLFAAARSAATPDAAAAALAVLLGQARRRSDFILAARTVAPLLLALRPGPELAGLAPDAARALFAADRPIEARQWFNATSPEAQRGLALVAHLAQGTDGPPPPPGGWAADLAKGAPTGDAASRDAGRRQAVLALTLLAAEGEAVFPAELAPLLGPPRPASEPLPGAASWVDQQAAAAGHRLGETVLMTLILAPAGDRLTAEPIALGRAVAGLRAVGLDADARLIAVEAALAAGL